MSATMETVTYFPMETAPHDAGVYVLDGGREYLAWWWAEHGAWSAAEHVIRAPLGWRPVEVGQ